MKKKSMWITLLMAGAVGLGSANVLIPDSVSPARKALLAEKESETIKILEEQCEGHEVAELAAGFGELKDDLESSSKLNRSRIYTNTHHAIAYLHHAMDEAETSTPSSERKRNIAQSYSEASRAEDVQGNAANVEYARARDRVYKEDYKDALQALYDIEEMLAPEYGNAAVESDDKSAAASTPTDDESSSASSESAGARDQAKNATTDEAGNASLEEVRDESE